MLGNNHFYYRLIRTYVSIFGSMFNDITIIRFNQDGTELKNLRVPINYGPKDRYVTRYESDPLFEKAVQTTLPRMSFEMKGISYDRQRKQISLLKTAKGSTTTAANTQMMGVPYDMEFELNIYARNTDDGAHIAEQIIPHFTPDFTVSTNLIADMGFLKDVAIILKNVDQNIQYEGDSESIRYVYWTMSFILKGYFYGPISKPKIIRKSIVNVYNDPSLVTGNIIKINTGEGSNGSFIMNDTVFQGNNYDHATAFGRVLNWNKESKKLTIGGAQGQWLQNNTVKAVSTNASYTIVSFDATPIKLLNVETVPDPLDADPLSDFGYSTTITEWPDTEFPQEG